MDTKDLVSIIIPAYNAALDLGKCVDHLVRQTYPNIEIIIVNDGSIDNTLEVAEALAKKDNRIRPISNERNLGLSETRNAGLRAATGKYVIFCDADDYVDLDLVEKGVYHLSKSGGDALVYGMVEEYFNQDNECKYTKNVGYPEIIYCNQEEMRRKIIDLEEKTLYGYSCNKMYLRERIMEEKIFFKTITLIEDILFNIDYFQNSKGMVVLDTVPYHYQKKINQSLTNKFVADYYELHVERVNGLWKQYESWKLLEPKVKQSLSNIYLRYLISALQRNCDPRAKMSHKDRRKWIGRVYQSDIFKQFSPYMKSNNPLLKLFSMIFKSKNKSLALMVGRVVYLIKEKMPILFSQLKQNR